MSQSNSNLVLANTSHHMALFFVVFLSLQQSDYQLSQTVLWCHSQPHQDKTRQAKDCYHNITVLFH